MRIQKLSVKPYVQDANLFSIDLPMFDLECDA